MARSTSRTFPGFDKVFVMEQGAGHAFRVEPPVSPDEELAATRGEAVPEEPRVYRWTMGRREPTDIIWTTGVFGMIVHSRVIDLLLDHGFTGWGTYPVAVYGKEGEHYPDYYGLVFRGRCGPLDESASDVVYRFRGGLAGPENKEAVALAEALRGPVPGGLVPYRRGLFFDPDTWDGTDFFMPERDTAWQFVTDEVRRAFKKARIKNVRLWRADEMEMRAEDL